MSEFPYMTDRSYPFLVSIAIPTRKRIHSGSLFRTLDSITRNTNDCSRIEVIIRADNDDQETIENIERIEEYNKHFSVKVIIDDRWGGYASIDKILNQCFERSTGQFFLSLTDDCTVDTKGWDDMVSKHDGKVGIIENSFQERDCTSGTTGDIRKPGIREIPWVYDGNHGCRHAIVLCHRIIPEILDYFICHISGDRQYDMITIYQPSLLIKEPDMLFTHYIQLSEHVKDGIVTHPDGIMSLKGAIEIDSERLVSELKKTYVQN